MEIRGRVHNGVVVLEGELPLPEGTEVIVSSGAAPRQSQSGSNGSSSLLSGPSTPAVCD